MSKPSTGKWCRKSKGQKSLIELVSNWNSQADRNPEERSLSQNQAVIDEIKSQKLKVNTETELNTTQQNHAKQ